MDYAQMVRENAARVSALGNWPAWMNGEKSLLERLPGETSTAAGFDTGLACALDLIPRDKQRLSAILHAAYTEEAVEQVRREAAQMDADSETTWWLAACSVCKEGGIDREAFERQIAIFTGRGGDPHARVEDAQIEFAAMQKKFNVQPDGIPFAVQDGGMQGAYLLGFNWAVQYNPAYGIFFIGTFKPSLGLEDFRFSEHADGQNRPMSGPVFGSRQFVKACTFDELTRAVAVVREHLGAPTAS
jgi:hypothetical protein